MQNMTMMQVIRAVSVELNVTPSPSVTPVISPPTAL
jgi:hypothetical protein